MMFPLNDNDAVISAVECVKKETVNEWWRKYGAIDNT